MDKTLEIVMVAVALVVAVVIVTGILQGQAKEFGDFSESQTSNSDCSVTANQLKAYCPGAGGGCSGWGPGTTACSIKNNAGSCSGLSAGNLC